MSRNPDQPHKKLDPLVREKHHRMVSSFIQRQEQAQRDKGIEIVVSILATQFAATPGAESWIRNELRGLATLMKREGYTRAEFVDAVHWIEGQVGFKLLPAATIQ